MPQYTKTNAEKT